MSNLKSVNENNFKQEVINTQIPVLVDFYATWCGPCKMLAPILDKVAEKLEHKIKIVKLDTDEASKIAAEYQISGVPCLILFKNGQEVKRIIGLQAEHVLVAQLESHI